MAGNTADNSVCEYSLSELSGCYRRMFFIRRFEETLGDLFSQNLLGGTSHFCIGQEACAVGVISESRDTDWLISNHRGHGHLLARGLAPARVMAELMGFSAGYCAGKGGSQHMCAMDHHFLGTNGITAGGLPIGTGAAFALDYRGSDEIAIVFFGDGASNQGTFHESLNMAALWKLPVLFVCENNLYGMSNPVARSTAGSSIVKRADSYDIRGDSCDGMELCEVKRHAGAMIEYVRSGRGPALLELHTYRFSGHSKSEPRVYRTREEEAVWAERDCIKLAEQHLLEAGMSKDQIDEIHSEVEETIAGAVEEAGAGEPGGRDLALEGIYA